MAKTEEKNQTLTMGSPYFLHPSDNPGMTISPIQLKGENYGEWARSVRNALRAKKKLGFIDGTISKSADDSSEIDDWWTVNSMSVTWIINTIESSLRSTISYVDNVGELWEELRQRFSIGNGPRVQQLKSDLANCKQVGLAVVAYYGKLKTMWDELANYESIPTYGCGGCKCDITKKLAQKLETEKIHQFLMGLNDVTFGTVRSNILGMEPLPTLMRIYSMIIQEERHKNIARTKEEQSDAIAFVAQIRQSAQVAAMQIRDKYRACNQCGRTGNESKACFEVIGYPNWWADRPRGSGRASRRGRGDNGSMGRGRGNTRANAAHLAYETKQQQNDVSDHDQRRLPRLSDDEWAALKSILHNQKIGSTEKLTGKNFDWLLDTGASHSMTEDIMVLHDMKEIAPCLVGLLNGEYTTALKAGTLCLGTNIYLHNVLYVPKMNCTLISIAQIVTQLSSLAIFFDKLCVIQDRATRTLIGAGRQHEGVYHFRAAGINWVNKAQQMNTGDLWHNRLGHPSNKVLKFITEVSSRNSCDRHVCDVCLRAKQTRDVFVTSAARASERFEIIHCDLWGPYKVPASCGAHYFLIILDDFSRAVWIYLLSKSEVPHLIKSFCAMTERQFDKRVKIIRSDNGTEIVCLKSYFSQNRIVHQTSCVGTPQQNRRVERKHRHILNVARALRFQANFPLTFWGECVLTAGYLINRTPTSLLDNKTPYELLFEKPPNYKLLKIFGCLCYAHRQIHDKDIFGERSCKCVFVGYPFGKKSWPVYDLEKKEYFVSRDVFFCETVFPFTDIESPHDWSDLKNVLTQDSQVVDDVSGVHRYIVYLTGEAVRFLEPPRTKRMMKGLILGYVKIWKKSGHLAEAIDINNHLLDSETLC